VLTARLGHFRRACWLRPRPLRAPRPSAPTATLPQANAALQAGEADKALALLQSASPGRLGRGPQPQVPRALHPGAMGSPRPRSASRRCKPRWAELLYHLWLGRALGEKADRASFLSAFSLAKRVRAEFEEAVRLTRAMPSALADLGEFYYDAPAWWAAAWTRRRDRRATRQDRPGRAHELRGRMAEQRKDYGTAEREFKQALRPAPHPAFQWVTLAGFLSPARALGEMESAVHSGSAPLSATSTQGCALRRSIGADKGQPRPALAAKMLEDYLAGSSKNRRGAGLCCIPGWPASKSSLATPPAPARTRCGLALAHEYKPAQDPGAGNEALTGKMHVNFSSNPRRLWAPALLGLALAAAPGSCAGTGFAGHGGRPGAAQFQRRQAGRSRCEKSAGSPRPDAGRVHSQFRNRLHCRLLSWLPHRPALGGKRHHAVAGFSYSQRQYIKPLAPESKPPTSASKMPASRSRSTPPQPTSSSIRSNRELEAAQQQEAFTATWSDRAAARRGRRRLRSRSVAGPPDCRPTQTQRLHLETRAATLAKQLAVLTGLPVGTILPTTPVSPRFPPSLRMKHRATSLESTPRDPSRAPSSSRPRETTLHGAGRRSDSGPLECEWDAYAPENASPESALV
jgi:tetratricopeptide (TPR) repeat protein